MDALSAAGIPVYGDAGPDGGYQLLGGFRTRLDGLTAGEAQALWLAGMPRAAADLGLGTVLATAQLKVQSALPAELRDRASGVAGRFLLDAPGWYQDGDSSPHLAEVADAVWNERRIVVRYRRWTAPTDVTRTLDPHGIVLKAGKWYLVARDAAAAEAGPAAAETGPGDPARAPMRTYRINQILGMTVPGERFSRVPDFDLAAFWASSLAGFLAGLWQGEATVRLSAAGREQLAALMSPAVVSAVDSTASPPDDGGWVTAVVPIESVGHAHQDFLRLGAEVEVLEPAALRDQLAATARSLAGLYAGG